LGISKAFHGQQMLSKANFAFPARTGSSAVRSMGTAAPAQIEAPPVERLATALLQVPAPQS
jgi:hypothetical protein